MLSKEIEIVERMGKVLQELVDITQMSEDDNQAGNLFVVVETLAEIYKESADELKESIGGI